MIQKQTSAAHKKRFEARLETELQQQGVLGPTTLARPLVILLDGATTVMLIHRDLAYADTVGQLALGLVEAGSEDWSRLRRLLTLTGPAQLANSCPTPPCRTAIPKHGLCNAA